MGGTYESGASEEIGGGICDRSVAVVASRISSATSRSLSPAVGSSKSLRAK
jgi:hypothetical protein